MSANEILDNLVAQRDACNRQGLERTAAAIQTALHIAYFESRLEIGKMKISASDRKSKTFLSRDKTLFAVRQEKMAKLRNPRL